MPDSALAPYPIRHMFRHRVAPALGLMALLLMAISWISINQLELHVYLETTERRVLSTIRLAHELAPAAWERMLANPNPQPLTGDGEEAVLNRILRGLGSDHYISHLKIFNSRLITLYSTDAKDIGVREENDLLRDVLTNERSQVESTVRNSDKLYEIYIPVRDDRLHTLIVFEVYEPVSVFDELITESFVRTTIAPLLLLLIIGVWLDRLTRGAQTDIDRRVEAQRTLRRQMERFISRSAIGAVRSAADGVVISRRVGMTLLYSDVRDFTSLAEHHPPQETVNFLNALMSLQVEVVRRHGGDVDKMIGDALLARFEGTDREARGILAAIEIQQTLAAAPMARGIGIGLFDGEAVLGVIGPEERQDFTVIGDSVNIAARLCSLARDGEVVVDEMALRRSGIKHIDFGKPERNRVKGRTGIVSTRRWRVAGAAEITSVPVPELPD